MNRSSKYNAVCKGKQSKNELRYSEWLKERGKEFEEQKTFVLQEGFEFEGERYLAIKFTPDFFLKDSNMFVDFKGAVDNVYPIKKKMFIKKYNYKLIEVGMCPKFLMLAFMNISNFKLECPYYTFDLKKLIKRAKIKKDTGGIEDILAGKIIYNHDVEAWDIRR